MALDPTAPNRTAGIASMTVDGVTYAVVSGLSWKVSDFKSDPLIGQSGFQGTQDSVSPGTIKAKLRDTAGVSTTTLVQKRAASIVVESANGKIITGVNMIRTGEVPEVNTEDATFDIEFTGASVTEN